ncbi:MAG: cob(I)yrinic acid a,c-diamide adenosyltransferase [Muribaculaceae bacterium]|jgi:ATP:cob(I)alamin adenosyltransferase|nr:cob(I)yrinic acid a,c-diamide adenosyltransferase [Muribaculaceae bacterium]
MKQIYTKTGDEGLTSLREGVRVAKDDPRIETNGQIDQLNACLGVVRSMLGDDEENRDLIHAVQRELMTVMSHLATPDGSENPRELHAAEITSQLERAIDQANFQGGFVVPGGGSQLSAFIHLARTQARTVERRLWSLNREHPVGSAVLVMMNRLSDYLFVLANEKE